MLKFYTSQKICELSKKIERIWNQEKTYYIMIS